MNKIISVSNPEKNEIPRVVCVVEESKAYAMREYLSFVRKDKADFYICESVSDFLSDEKGRIAWEAFQAQMR
jgi:hypothetical protein